MRMIDLKCAACARITYDHLERDEDKTRPACECGGQTERVFLPTKTGGVIDDSIPGGLWISNGLCNRDGTPKRYDSHSDIRKEAYKRGLEQHVVHQPARGSDKSKNTTKWV